MPDTALAFQETDLLTGISYLQSLAASLRLPLVLCIGLGTAQGDHAGGSPLNTVLNEAARKAGFFPVAAAGNEAGLGHHFYGQVSSENTPVTAELLVSEDTLGFSMELWGQTPERFALSVTSPLGETIPELFPRLRQQAFYSFALERTILSINYELAETQSGNQLILLRFSLPTPGSGRFMSGTLPKLMGSFISGFPLPGFFLLEPSFLPRTRIPLLRILGTLPGASLPAPIMPMTGACTSTPAGATLEPEPSSRILLPLACLLRACARHPACRDFATPPLPALP